MRILYLENHAVFAANVIGQFLARHSVLVATSLADASRALATGSFDLLLVDYDLDDGKGDALVKELYASSRPMLAIGVSSHDEGTPPCCGQARWPFAARCTSTGFRASSTP